MADKPPIKTVKSIDALDLRDYLGKKYSSMIYEVNDEGVWGDLFGWAVSNDEYHPIVLEHDDHEMHNTIIDLILVEYPELTMGDSLAMWVCW